MILDPHLGKLSRRTRPELLETLATGTLAQRVELTAKLLGLQGLSLEEVQARTGIKVEALTKELKNVPNVTRTGATFLHHDVLADFRRRSMSCSMATSRRTGWPRACRRGSSCRSSSRTARR